MADNTQANLGSGGDLISTDQITTLNGAGIATNEKAQRVKTGWGVDGTFNDTSASAPLPVVQTGTPALPTGAATQATLASILTNTPAVGQTTKAASKPVTIASDQVLNTTDSTVSGTITAADAVVAAPSGNGIPLTGASTAGSIVAIQSNGGASSWLASLTGTISGTYYFEVSNDSTNGTNGTWVNVNGRQTGLVSTTTLADYKTTVTGDFRGSPAAASWFRVRNVGGSGLNTTVALRMSTGVGPVFLYSSIPTGTNVIGKVGIDQTTPGTTNGVQVNAALPTGANTIGNVGITGTVVVDDLAAAATGATVPANAQYTGNLAQTALPSAATAGNLTGNLSDKFGRQVVVQGTIRDLVATQTTTISASTTETTIVTAAASTFNDLTALVVSNTSATAVRVDFRDTTAGSVLFSLYVPAGDVRGAAFNRPIPQTAVNTNWTAQSSASVTDLRVYAVWDKNK